MSIFVTGDIHGDGERLIEFAHSRCLDEQDVIIIAGDFGCVWNGSDEENKCLDYLSESLEGCNLAFVSGNHENFDLLEKFPVKTWAGGRAQFIRKNIIHLMRGEMFFIDGKKIFAFGGARSTDIKDGLLNADNIEKLREEICALERQGRQLYRIVKYNWWKQEMPSEEEKRRGIACLEKWKWETDFVVTHCCPSSIQTCFSLGIYEEDELTQYFQKIYEQLKFRCWYFGHYHEDMKVGTQFYMLYKKILQIG